MMKFYKKFIVSSLLVPFLIATLSFISFQYNGFFVADQRAFLNFDPTSERLVQDGLKHNRMTNEKLTLGLCQNESQQIQNITIDETDELTEYNCEFTPYRSQYGLQIHLFYMLDNIFNLSIEGMKFIVALLVSVVMVIFYCTLRREFSGVSAFLFCLALITSPWVVFFSRSLYWLEALWLLPMLISFLFGVKSLNSRSGKIYLGAGLTIAFLLKNLCGYEYITTIGLSAIAPLVYFTIKYDARLSTFFVQTSIAAFSFIIAFLLSIALHANAVGGSIPEGITIIKSVALKRIGSPDTAYMACTNLNEIDRLKCVDEVKANSRSLASNGLLVVGSYFVFKEFLPWFGNLRYHPEDRPKLMSLKRDFSFSKFNSLNLKNQSIIALLSYALSCFAFIGLIACSFVALAKSNNRALGGLLIISALAPLSWFLLAKGHSYVHQHLNYVLWYIPFIPVAVLTLSEYLITSGFISNLRQKTKLR